MGTLFYGNSDVVEIPDRLLAHVKVVITTKLRRNESFTLSWRHAEDAPEGRTTIWLQPAIPLRFVFESAEPEKLDGDLLRSLAHHANSTAGVQLDLEADADEPVGADEAPGPRPVPIAAA